MEKMKDGFGLMRKIGKDIKRLESLLSGIMEGFIWDQVEERQ